MKETSQRYGAVSLAIAIALSLLGIAACQRRTRPLGIDPSDQSQAANRTALTQSLPDLFFIPTARAGYIIEQVIRAPLIGSDIDVIGAERPANCSEAGLDTCEKVLAIWRWNPQTRIYTRTLDHRASFATVSTLRLGKDVKNDLLLFTHNIHENRRGLKILGLNNTGAIVERYHSDSTVPAFTMTPEGVYALIEWDSLRLNPAGYRPEVPYRYLRSTGEAYVEAPSDPYWTQLLHLTRDSIHQLHLVTHDEMTATPRPIRDVTINFTRTLIAEAWMDTSWSAAQTYMQRELASVRKKLSSEQIAAIENQIYTDRAGPYIRWGSARSVPAIVLMISELDRALDRKDSITTVFYLTQLRVTSRDIDPLLRAVKAANTRIAAQSVIQACREVLARATELAPRSAEAWRARGWFEERRGNFVEGRTFLINSLRLDSLSSQAQEVRRQVGDY
jgi:hypothetical protein